MKYKVSTKWTGYSEIIVEAKNEKHAEILRQVMVLNMVMMMKKL
jgi:hypothetical protein